MNKIILRPLVTVEEKNMFEVKYKKHFKMLMYLNLVNFKKMILPAEDIEESFKTEGSEAYIAEFDGEKVGGTIIVIDDKIGYNSLHFLYVKLGAQDAGNGLNTYTLKQEFGKRIPRITISETFILYKSLWFQDCRIF